MTKSHGPELVGLLKSTSEDDTVKVGIDLHAIHKLGSSLAFRSNNGLFQSVVIRDGKSYSMSMQDGIKNHPILVAEKKRGNYLIRSVNDGVLGVLVISKSNNSVVEYNLCLQDHTVLASIHYEVPSLALVLTEGPPRRAQVQIGACRVETKQPHSKQNKHLGLNFQGRGREGSRKNMQLEDCGEVVLQMVKWDKSHFHVDYK